MESVLDELAADTAGKAVVGIVPQSEKELFATFNVRSIPAIFVFYNSEVRQTYLGSQDKETLARFLKTF